MNLDWKKAESGKRAVENGGSAKRAIATEQERDCRM